MIWIIVGVIFFIVTIWSLKGTTFVKYNDEKRVAEFHAPIWTLIIAFIGYCIPYISPLLFITYSIWFLTLVARKSIYEYDNLFTEYIIIELSEKNALHRVLISIGKFLIRTI